MTDRQPSPVFSRSYDLLLWLIPCTLNFPRSQRGVMARQLQREAFVLYGALVDAVKSEQPGDDLRRADAALIKLRTYLRLSHELRLLSPGQYEHGAKLLAEVGRLLGGWQKKVS